MDTSGIEIILLFVNFIYPVITMSTGNVYIADRLNNRIRKITVSTGIILTIAGSGSYGYNGDEGAATSATLSYPFGVAVDSSGMVYSSGFYP